jgi:radical SAM protein with 4Fe4S-binding SPASM domain
VPNVLMTEQCVRSCPYCFAGKRMAHSDRDSFLSWEDLIYIADLHKIAGEKSVRLLGGEPTLHPQFVDMVLYLSARGFHVHVFTSGILSDSRLSELETALQDMPAERVSFTCNINDPQLSPPDEVSRVEQFLEVFGNRITPGFNIYHLEFALEFIFQYINAFGLHRHIRIGLAHPIFGHDNLFVAPQQIEKAISRLVNYFPLFERLKVRIGLDCGFPLCKFSDEQLGKLYYLNEGRIRFGCDPVIDIGPDAMVWACFPLSEYHRRSLYEFDHLNQVREFYDGVFRNVRIEVGGIFEECDHCPHRESGLCKGGCIAHSLNMMQNEPPVRKLQKVSV